MKRETETRLLDFCVDQQREFSAAAWTQFAGLPPLELAVAARYLAGTDWFGHREQLSLFADTVSPLKFAELRMATGFDPGRFRGLLQARLARGTSARCRTMWAICARCA